MKKELASRLLLDSNWRCTSTTRKAKEMPTLLVNSSVSYPNNANVESGEASIRCTDGTEWKKAYSNKEQFYEIIENFLQFTAELRGSHGSQD